MPKRPIDKTLDAFQLGDLQTFRTILETLIIDKWSVPDAIEHINHLTDMQNNPLIRVLKRRCPECNEGWMSLSMVNHAPGAMVGGDWNCQWLCMACKHEEYSTKEIQEEAKPYIEEVRHGNR